MVFKFGDNEIVPSSEAKFLGITIDKNLKFSKHVDTVCKKLSSGIFVLNQLSNFSDTKVLLAAYYGLIYPYLAYAVPIWGHENTRTKFIFKLQKKAIRVIFRKPRTFSCKSLFTGNNILTFPSIYILEAVFFVHKNLHLFQTAPSTHRYSLRRNDNIKIPPHRTSFYEQHLGYNGVRLYNSLPEYFKSFRKLDVFRRKVKSYLLEKCYYKVSDFIL